MSMRITTGKLRERVERINNYYGTNLEVSCYQPGSQTLCQLGIAVGDGVMNITPYMSPREINQILDAIEKLKMYKEKGWLKGDLV